MDTDEWADDEGNMDTPDFPKPTTETAEEKWRAEGEAPGGHYKELSWRIGDWIVRGEEIIRPIGGETVHGYHIPVRNVYTEAEEITQLGRAMLRDLASTARRATVRNEKLSWTHHRVLVNLHPSDTKEQMREHLDRAVQEQLSVAAFAKSLKSQTKPATLGKSMLVKVPIRVYEALKDMAADKADEDLTIGQVAATVVKDFVESDKGIEKRKMAKIRTKERRHALRSKVGRRVARSYDSLGLNR